MEQGFGSGSNAPPVSIDKTRVLDVKPLRRLVPVFPNPPGMSSVSNPTPTPFICVSPSGPFPPGVQPFYPFLAPNDTSHTTPITENRTENFGFATNVPAPVPLNSFRTPTPQANGSTGQHKKNSKTCASESIDIDDDEYTDADITTSSGRRTGRRKQRTDDDGESLQIDTLVNDFLTKFKLKEFNDFKRTMGDSDTVRIILLVYNLLRKRLTQIEESKEMVGGGARRPNLKAANLLMTKGIRTNSSKRIGHVPGIEIGDIFFFRMELCLVGLHAPSMAGIDYMGVKISMDEEPVAVSVVSSGGYEDEGGDGDVLVYTGHGGVQRSDGQMFDQKLERGNLALEKSLHRANDVRVIRGMKDIYNQTGKIYVYDGVYKIQESWAEKNKLGLTIFKYKLVRVPGQVEAFSLWKSIQQWRDKTVTRTGLILPDLSSGAESLPVTLVNNIDGEKGLAHFNYVSALKYSAPFPTSEPYLGCHCKGGCQPGDTNCPCNLKNDGYLLYSSLGVLLTNKSPLHECGSTCICPPNCRNRISQGGIRVRLEVFKTKNRGWGLRSWDPIRSGSFICEYAGEVIKVSDFGNGNDDNYIFDATRYYEPLEAVHDDSRKIQFPLVISAKNVGNVARFMNHCCLPNVFWQPVLRESNDGVYLHVAFFAIQHIPPMQELTFDYGIVTSEKGDNGKKKCLCESVKCRGYFY